LRLLPACNVEPLGEVDGVVRAGAAHDASTSEPDRPTIDAAPLEILRADSLRSDVMQTEHVGRVTQIKQPALGGKE